MAKKIKIAVELAELAKQRPNYYGAVLADPPWRFKHRTGKGSPEHRRLHRYRTMSADDIAALPVHRLARDQSHLYLWVPVSLLRDGLQVMSAWGFGYKTSLIWHKICQNGETDKRGLGFYFRNAAELCLFGVRGAQATLAPGRSTSNVISAPRTEHSRKPDEIYTIVESCSQGPYLELFARRQRYGWTACGDQAP